ncbi:unnamed protein product, partial [Lampetra planeri]
DRPILSLLAKHLAPPLPAPPARRPKSPTSEPSESTSPPPREASFVMSARVPRWGS